MSKSIEELRKRVVSKLLQYKAELSQGLNQLATGKTATELSADSIMHLFTQELDRRVEEVRISEAKLYQKELSTVKRETTRLPGTIVEVPGPGETKLMEFSTPEDARKAIQLLAALNNHQKEINK